MGPAIVSRKALHLDIRFPQLRDGRLRLGRISADPESFRAMTGIGRQQLGSMPEIPGGLPDGRFHGRRDADGRQGKPGLQAGNRSARCGVARDHDRLGLPLDHRDEKLSVIY